MRELSKNQEIRCLAGLGPHARRSPRSEARRFRPLLCGTVILSAGLLLIGCSVRVEYLTDDVFPARDSRASVEWLEAEPNRPYHELARITVSQTFAGEERLRQMIVDRARALGAEAVLDDGMTRAITPGAPPYFEPALFGSESPYYESGLLGPKGAAFGLYGYGWYSPFSSNPFILTQGATDQPRVAKSLSAVAIRYRPEAGVNGTP